MTVRSVVRHGKRRWFIEIPYQENGKRVRFRRDAAVQTLTGARAEDARRLKLLALTGRPFEVERAAQHDGSTPFKEVVERFFVEYAPSRLKPSTIFGYRKVVARHLVPAFGSQPIASIDAVLVRRFDAQLVAGGMSAATRHHVLTLLRSIVRRYAPEAGLLAEVPNLPRLPRVGTKTKRAMTEAEFRRLLEVSGPALRRAILLGGRAGLRAGEIRGLRARDVDLAARELVVRVSICNGVEGTPKSGHERRVPLVRELAEELADVEHRSPKARVSLSPRGRIWGPTGLGASFVRACKRARIGHWRFHDLRHLFITSLFRSGAPAPVVQMVAGHLHLSVTQRYAHATSDDVTEAMRRLDQALSSG